MLKTRLFKNAMHVYTAELISSMGISVLHMYSNKLDLHTEIKLVSK